MDSGDVHLCSTLLYCKEISRDLNGRSKCAGNIYLVPWQNPRKSSFPVGGPHKHFFRVDSRSKMASIDTSRQPGNLLTRSLHYFSMTVVINPKRMDCYLE